MIVDSAAVPAIVFWRAWVSGVPTSDRLRSISKISSASFLEAAIVAETREGDRAARQCGFLVQSFGISIEAFTEEQAILARQESSRFGEGRHPANLNFGDCFSYALAKATGEPLLFKGEGFRKTDVQPAIPQVRQI